MSGQEVRYLYNSKRESDFYLPNLHVSRLNPIPVPPFLTNYSMSSILGGTGSIVGFFMSELNIGPSLALIGAGYVFRLLRKFLTLFQW